MVIQGEQPQFFTAQDLVGKAGAKYRNIDHWVREGVIKPIMEARGSGSARVYDFSALVAVYVLIQARKFGIETRAVADVLEWLRAYKPLGSITNAMKALDEGPLPVLCWNGKKVRQFKDFDFSSKEKADFLLMINLSGIVLRILEEFREGYKAEGLLKS